MLGPLYFHILVICMSLLIHLKNQKKKIMILGKTQMKIRGLFSGVTTKVWYPSPIDLIGSNFFSSMFQGDPSL